MTDDVARSTAQVGSISVVRAHSTVQALHTHDPLRADRGPSAASDLTRARDGAQSSSPMTPAQQPRNTESPDTESPFSVLWCDFVDSALILGSRQDEDLVDLDRLTAAGIELARRRSGGGAVLAVPGSLIWVDLVVASPTLQVDVRESMLWAGELWRRALTRLGCGDGLTVHRGPMVTDEWGKLVCFAGLGPGEVLADGRKLVGLSQRRTRWGARISGAIHLHSLIDETANLLALPLPAGSPPVIATAAVNAEQVAETLAAELNSAMTTAPVTAPNPAPVTSPNSSPNSSMA